MPQVLATLKAKWDAYRGYLIGGGVLLAVAALVWFINDYRDLKGLAMRQAAEVSTLSTEFKRVGDAVVGQGALLKTESEGWREASALQGKQLTDAMRQQNASIMALFEAQGRILSEVVHNQGASAAVQPGVDGSFTGAKMVQGRTAGPALTDVTLRYNPKDPDPSKRLLGDWTNYREDFFPSVVEWQKADKGFSGTFRLRREVFRPDGSKVGSEEIPITYAKATFDPQTLPGRSAEVPRFTISGGAAWDWQKRTWGPAVLGDYRVTSNWGVGGGWAGNQALLMTSFRFSLR